MLKFYILILIILLFSFACSTQPQPVTVNDRAVPLKSASPLPASTPTDINVELSYNIERNSSGKFKITGQTNLPDKTQLGASIYGKSVKYTGQTSVVVSNGKFETEEFSLQGKSLPPGSYESDVSMPIAQVQPKEIQQIIGKNGENLKGSLVKRDELGARISIEKEFQIKSDGSIAGGINQSDILDSKKSAMATLKALKELEQQGRSMESLRDRNNLQGLSKCGDLMRKYGAIADDLRTKIESSQSPYSTYLGGAAIELKMCVNCSSSALDSCNRARSYIQDAEKELAK
jgi:hypothetical protein